MGVSFHESVRFNDDYDSTDAFSWKQFVFHLKQQRLKGQIPVVTKRYAISITVFFAFLFLGISKLIATANTEVTLIKIRYDNITNGYIDINITKCIPPPVYFYYELRNTFNMHRTLNQAYCKKQLAFGDSTECDTFKNSKYSCLNPSESTSLFSFFHPKFCLDNQKFYAPVGGAASIMFNDYFKLTLNDSEISWTEEGVIVDKLRDTFFQPEQKNLCDAKEFQNTVKPIGWKHHICEMGGYRNISFIKWLEPTTNKNFKKLYRILDTTKHRSGLKIGVYRLHFDNVYNPTVSHQKHQLLEKYFWILHPSWLGTKQDFLEKMYLIVGVGLLALSCFLVGFQIFLMDRRKVYDDDNE